MESSSDLKFRISAALKNIIGKELITDQYIAIFELVKNSFDAHAKNVTLTFENINNSSKSKVIIVDDGKGMDYDDLINKWLFVAYSAKKDGTEDINMECDEAETNSDYRDMISPKRVFAGAKGVGRFSCDRLGSKLSMATIKDKQNALIENLDIDWEDFEKDDKAEFVDIDVKRTILTENAYNLKHGTVLEIFGLRDVWDRDKLLKLKASLEKLINPSQENGSKQFSIEMVVNEELENDKIAEEKVIEKAKNRANREGREFDEKEIEQEVERNQVNGKIKNSLFEMLGIKTTQIITEITEDGKYIITTLKDRGTLIYKITENNPFTISDVKIHLFQLNRAAKVNFAKIMGIAPIKYGNVFMYKNGFRVYPFGEEKEDTLGIDRRKIQGRNRYLGTRDLIGRIEINGNDETLKETTSRDGGLIKNRSYDELVNFFYEKALKRLEKYVVDIIKWGDPYKLTPDDKEYQLALNPNDVKNKIREIIERLSNSKEFMCVEHDENFLDIIEKSQDESVSATLKDLSIHAIDKKDDKLLDTVNKLNKKFVGVVEAKKEVEREVQKKEIELKQVTEELEQTTKQNLFLKSVANTDIKEVLGLQHHIDRATDNMGRNLDSLVEAINANLPKERILNFVKRISLDKEKISTIARFVTKANFNLKATEIDNDLVQFVNEYIENVYLEYEDLKINRQLLNIKIDTPKGFYFQFRFRPLEVIIVLDNLLSNSYKAGAKNVLLSWKLISKDTVQISFIDDGKGITTEKLDRIFDFGYTTTNGSGIGLYHVKDIIENKIGGAIRVNNKLPTGVEFILEVKK